MRTWVAAVLPQPVSIGTASAVRRSRLRPAVGSLRIRNLRTYVVPHASGCCFHDEQGLSCARGPGRCSLCGEPRITACTPVQPSFAKLKLEMEPHASANCGAVLFLAERSPGCGSCTALLAISERNGVTMCVETSCELSGQHCFPSLEHWPKGCGTHRSQIRIALSRFASRLRNSLWPARRSTQGAQYVTARSPMHPARDKWDGMGRASVRDVRAGMRRSFNPLVPI